MKIVLAFVLLSTGLAANTLQGTVTNVVDGNTIEFQSSENEVFTFLLAGIDCPELEQPFGPEAKALLEKLIGGRDVVITIEGKDRRGTRFGSLTYAKDKDPRIKLLENGLAWTAEKNPNPEFEALKEASKSRGKGLWEQVLPIPPWLFRRQQTMIAPKSS
jgi:micrococcal nuclease